MKYVDILHSSPGKDMYCPGLDLVVQFSSDSGSTQKSSFFNQHAKSFVNITVIYLLLTVCHIYHYIICTKTINIMSINK